MQQTVSAGKLWLVYPCNAISSPSALLSHGFWRQKSPGKVVAQHLLLSQLYEQDMVY